MEKIKMKCSICGTVHEGDFWHLRQFFTTNKTYRTGLDPRCKECKKVIAKKYRTSKVGDKTHAERYKATNEKRALYAKYMNREAYLLSDHEINDAIKAIENRLKALKKEQQKRKNN